MNWNEMKESHSVSHTQLIKKKANKKNQISKGRKNGIKNWNKNYVCTAVLMYVTTAIVCECYTCDG